MHSWNSWDNNGNAGDNYGLWNTLFSIKFVWSQFLSFWLSSLILLLTIHIILSRFIKYRGRWPIKQCIIRMPCHCCGNGVDWHSWHWLWYHCPASRTTLVATRFRVAVICPIIQVPHCIRVFFYFVWFVFINHIFQFYYELCTYCNILDIYLS